MGSLDDNVCWSLVKPPQTKGAFLPLLSPTQDVFPCSGHSMALFKLKCDLFPDSSALCCDILSQFWSIMRDPHRLIATPSLYLDFMMNPIRDKPIAHAHQRRDSATVRHSGVWEELPLKSEHDPTEINPLSSLFFYCKAPLLKLPTGRLVFPVNTETDISVAISLLSEGSGRSVLSSGVVL